MRLFFYLSHPTSNVLAVSCTLIQSKVNALECGSPEPPSLLLPPWGVFEGQEGLGASPVCRLYKPAAPIPGNLGLRKTSPAVNKPSPYVKIIYHSSPPAFPAYSSKGTHQKLNSQGSLLALPKWKGSPVVNMLYTASNPRNLCVNLFQALFTGMGCSPCLTLPLVWAATSLWYNLPCKPEGLI